MWQTCEVSNWKPTVKWKSIMERKDDFVWSIVGLKFHKTEKLVESNKKEYIQLEIELGSLYKLLLDRTKSDNARNCELKQTNNFKISTEVVMRLDG